MLIKRLLGFAQVIRFCNGSNPQNTITITERIHMSTENRLLGFGITAKPNNLILAHQLLGFEDILGFAGY